MRFNKPLTTQLQKDATKQSAYPAFIDAQYE